MSRTQKKATEIGLAISDRISEASLKFIEEWDPDLYEEILKANKDRGRRKK